MTFSSLDRHLQTALVWLLARPRPQKRAIQLCADVLILAACFLLALFLRLESWSSALTPSAWVVFGISLPFSLAVFVRLGFYRAVIRYISARAFRVIAIGVGLSALVMFLSSQLLGLWLPRSVPFLYALLALVSVGAIRFVMRGIYRSHNGRGRPNVLIYGAGDSGRQLFHSLHHSREYRPVGFVDDDPALRNAVVGGLSVFGRGDIAHLIDELDVQVVLLAIPSASRDERAELIAFLEPLPVRVQTIPGLLDLISGKASIGEIRAVSVEDVLGRDPVPPQADLMAANIAGKSVLVSGAGGSIGSELCRQILNQAPARLVLLDISEYALYAIEHELAPRAAAAGVDLVALIANAQDRARAEWLMRRFGVDTVFHAAAYKHVPLVEQNMIAGVRNNVFGTMAMADAAQAAGVGAFILVSTDKAVRPTNVMGASKRLAELVCQSRVDGPTLFSMVRFGNVLGSSGSVIPLFTRQIAAGGPVTVTHPDITRYFMTIPEAAQLVIQAGAMARGGDVFLLDMGDPVRIVDLAARMIRLSGLVPVFGDAEPATDGSVPIVFTSLRPGEKLYEELLIDRDCAETLHPRILTARERSLTPVQLSVHLDAVARACDANDLDALRTALRMAPTFYDPRDAIADLTGHAERERADVA
ncbi:polysaccharide biosynthesis protein [Meridianimarinicoccus sp. RP-17]|uniref:nucleoside-diphosphate sugar epimerase/dehydratase n=1 Tax=Meridianimarinicoccus zhengii TaxID=2056810 RepID=UPI000DADAB34|nr:nucleoside-diphosphate sugar epimerase/dehydratase [Phycocomes zhengii]